MLKRVGMSRHYFESNSHSASTQNQSPMASFPAQAWGMHRTQLIEKKKKKEKKTKEISFFSSFLFLPQSESEAQAIAT
jgi:hypothetical protein